MRLRLETPVGPAEAELARPPRPAALVVIGHGAGGGIEAPDIRAAAKGCLDAGAAVARVLQPYRVAGRRSPSPAPTLDAAWVSVVAQLRRRRGLGALPLIVAGRSSGARVACRTAHEVGAAAVFCLAFPLHPPGRPDRSRLAELETVDVPVLVVQGDRDAFGMPPRARHRTVHVIAGADHGLKRDAVGISAVVRTFVEAALDS
jgi:predicted alpha/beta-hydrolase family hydrolase